MKNKHKVALFIWGDTFESFYDTLSISREQFLNSFTGSWQFNYAKALQSVGVDVTIFYTYEKGRGSFHSIHKPSGINVTFLPAPQIFKHLKRFNKLPGISTLRSYLSTNLWALERELLLGGYDAIITQEYEYARFDVCVWLGKKLGIPVYATFQGGDKTNSILEIALRNWTIKNCTGLLVGSRKEISRLDIRYNIPTHAPTLKLNKIHNVPNPFDINDWPVLNKQECRRKLNMNPNAKVTIWHGRIDIQRKGLDILLKAFERIETKACLVIIGKGVDEIELATMKRLNKKCASITFANKFISDTTELATWLTAADLYVFPSRKEGFPIAPIEALACGLPIVATRAQGVEEILTGCDSSSRVVDIDDIDSLVKYIDLFLKIDEDFSKRTRAKAEQFSLEKIGAQLKNIIYGESNE